MNTVEIITKKRDGLELSWEEIDFFVKGITSGEIPDYQITPFLMAIYLNGMTDQETYYLTRAMMESGEIVDLSDIKGFKVDKHSTGGVGDKLTLISCPIAAAAGVKIAKMSGRGLGFTGGTIDKLKSIPGFSTDISMDIFKENVDDLGISVISQSEKIANADKIIYALRDVSGTVESIPMIVSSIMSKKLALGADGIILDVKYGEGALMKTYEEAQLMAKKMQRIGQAFGKKVEYILSPMSEPLGRQVGNANEVMEAIDFFKGISEPDLKRQALELAGRMIHLAGLKDSIELAIDMAECIVNSGRALAVFKGWVTSQGGNPNIISDYSLLPGHDFTELVTGIDLGITQNKTLKSINAFVVGEASNLAGAGRMVKDEPIDLGAGIAINCKGGSTVSADTVVFEIYGNDLDKIAAAKEKLIEACLFE